jgi:bacterioferritin-associated ferredoxin
MVVCICRAVSDRTIESAIRDGASTVADVSRHCRAGTGCGACHGQVAEMISRYADAKDENRKDSCANCPNARSCHGDHVTGEAA